MGVHGRQAAQQLAEETRGEGVFLSLKKDGDRALIVLYGEEYALKTIFDDQEGTIDVDTPAGEKYLAKNPKAKKQIRFRARFHAIVLGQAGGDDTADLVEAFKQQTEDGGIESVELRAQVLEMSKTTYGDACKKDGRKPFSKWVYELERSGEGKQDTSYSLTAQFQISEIDGLADAIESVELQSLEDPGGDDDAGSKSSSKASKGSRGGSGAKSGKSGGSSSTIGKDDLEELKQALQEHRELLPDLCAAFGVAKIKELPKAKMPDVRAWIADKTGAANAEDDTEEDPFA